ncbi:MAG: hypothetical protein GSR73_00270 [Desulfurococcales archaeon]|nr:hypothetical protein [Desulfurococcales archaeon]
MNKKRRILYLLGLTLSILTLAIAATPSAAIYYDRDWDENSIGYVYVSGVFDDREGFARSNHYIEVYTVPENEIIRATGTLQWDSGIVGFDKYFFEPGTYTRSLAPVETAEWVKASTYISFVSNGNVVLRATVELPP